MVAACPESRMAVRRVLIVEDHPPMRRMLEDLLASIGFGTTSVSNGAEALEYLATATPDLIITDYIMPRLNGIQLAHSLRKRPEWAKIPIVIVSSVDANEIERAGANAGIRRVIGKPFSREVIVTVVNEVLGTGVRVTAD